MQPKNNVPSTSTGPTLTRNQQDQRYQAKVEYQDTMPPHKFRHKNYPFSCQWWDIFPGRLEKLGMQGAQTTAP